VVARPAVVVIGVALSVAALGGCGDDEEPTRVAGAPPGAIQVPADAATIQEAVDEAEPGDLVLVSPGVYEEHVVVTTDRIVVRGVDRNETILDGGNERANGIEVREADGVAIENLTARNFTANGFVWTGVKGYRGSYLTAYNNGLYGIFAFGSVQGQFDHSYASGHPDSGFYIGQCNPCDAVITDVVAEYNQLGYSGTNASGNLVITNSEWRENRTGIVPNTLDSEELPPQGQATIVGNLVLGNRNGDAAQSDEEDFDAAFGGGIIVVGGVGNVVERNRVVDHVIGIALAPNPGIQENYWPATANQVLDNVVENSDLADLAAILPVPGDGNCFAGNRYRTSAPADIEAAMPCAGAATSDLNLGALDLDELLDEEHPEGLPYQDQPEPPAQANMPDATTAPPRPATDVPTPIDVDAIRLPSQ
jgi:hypothetical protein